MPGRRTLARVVLPDDPALLSALPACHWQRSTALPGVVLRVEVRGPATGRWCSKRRRGRRPGRSRSTA